jgi:hypothetical protein
LKLRVISHDGEEGGGRKEEGGRSALIVFGWNGGRTVMVEVENEDELIQ